MDTLAIIKRIEIRLSAIGMSKAEFYEKSGISSASFSQWRTGTYKPSMKKLSNAANAIGLPIDYLVSGIGYGGGSGSGAGFDDGSGYGGPILESDTAYDRAVELCAIYTVNNMSFHDICHAAGLTEQDIYVWKNGKLPERKALEKIAEYLLVPVDFLLGEEAQKKSALSEADLTEDEFRILSAFREMSPERQKALADLLGISDS